MRIGTEKKDPAFGNAGSRSVQGTRGSKGPGEVAEEKPATSSPPAVVAKRVPVDTPPPTIPVHTDDRDASIFVFHKKEVGPAVG